MLAMQDFERRCGWWKIFSVKEWEKVDGGMKGPSRVCSE
jgi:hypothetical protein